MGFVLQFALCRVVCLARRCMELRLLTLQELYFLVGTSVDLVDAAEQRQDNKKGRLKPSNIHNIGPIHCFLGGCFSILRGHMQGWANRLALAEALRVFPCKFFSVCFLSPVIYMSSFYTLAKTP